MEDLEISPYLTDHRFSKGDRELLFKLRTRTVSVKENFKNAYQNNDMLCELCKLFPCTQSHPTQCPQLKTKMVVDPKLVLCETDVFGHVDKQLIYAKIYRQFWELRETLIQDIRSDTN